MNHFTTIQQKLEAFIKKYYINELLRGSILFFSIGMLYFLFTLFVEYVLWLNPKARTILFWLFVTVEVVLFARFIVLPFSKLFKLQKGLDYESASKIIGNHFPEVSDKLLNVLQLKSSNSQSELLLASIDQKSIELSPVPFKMAINFKSNIKYLKYAIVPLLIILISLISGKYQWFSDSYKRVINHSTAYEPPAPFQFFVVNESLKGEENKDFKLVVKTAGKLMPESAKIHFNDEEYYLQNKGTGSFEYVFTKPTTDIEFFLSANDVNSRDYILKVSEVPSIVGFSMYLDYPAYTGKKDAVIKSTGNAVVPEGTNIRWELSTNATDQVVFFANDTTQFAKINDIFSIEKMVVNPFDYNLHTSNKNFNDYEELSFRIDVLKDLNPEIKVQMKLDSLDMETMYFHGQLSDDYGLRGLKVHFNPSDNPEKTINRNITIKQDNFDEFLYTFPGQLEIEPGVPYDVYFEVTDNDAVNGFKSSKSPVFRFRKRTVDEEKDRQLQQQSETIDDLKQSLKNFEEQEDELKEISKTQKEKNQLNFSDKKKLEEFLKRQKQQDELMKQFNKQEQEHLEKFDETQPDAFKESLKERLRENEEQLERDEKLLEELEKLQEKIDKENLNDKLEQLAKQNKNKKRSMEQLLELTKHYYVGKKYERLQQELDQLAKEQEELSNKTEKENSSKEQDSLNKKFDDFKKEMDSLQKDNKGLKRPMDLKRDKKSEEEIDKDQQDAQESLEQQEQSNNPQEQQKNAGNAQKKQKQAAQKMKQMSEQMMMQMSGGGGGAEQMSEDMDMIRQILDNLILFSFNQENVMNQFSSIEVNHNEYANYLRKQSDLREHFQHVDDSLFALSLRQPMISEFVNKEINEVYFNIDKSLGQFSENMLYQGIASQQYTITAANNLADFLSETLNSMQMQMQMMMSSGSGQGKQGQGQNGQQLQDIIISQEELNKKMEEMMGKQGKSEGGQEGEGKDGENGDKEGEQKGDKGKQGKGEGKGGQDGEGEMNGEEMNGELFEIYQQQQQLRESLFQLMDKEGLRNKAGEKLLKDMENVELDLLNNGITQRTMSKMIELKHQLLKLENATFQQGRDTKRESQTNYQDFNNSVNDNTPDIKQYFNTTEILNRQSLPLRHNYKKKVQQYFKDNNDQL
ncbi:DUF4175 family protein [Mangrovimonas aestuarii]|uniref:DUF4175 family protein n=1 Tax=Mangrovimonas aestuarii TaxID=3018443 RepID=UPI002378E3C7|nr:DUF4175 family protein [Mangrovimonas aestuarii]